MRRRIWQLLLTLAAVISLGACGGNTTTTTTKDVTTGLKKRVMVTNNFSGVAMIFDAEKDLYSGTSIQTGGQPGPLYTVPGAVAVSYEDFDHSVSLMDTVKETLVARIALGDKSDSQVLTSDGKQLFAAIRNLSRVDVVNVTGKSLTTVTGIPQPRRLAITPSNSKVLAFSDDFPNNVYVVNVADGVVTTVPGFDRAFTALFASDSSKAYILNCGAECGGAQAKVSVLDLATNTVTGSVNVDGATVGALDNNTLYVAGNNLGGKLDVLDVNTLAPPSKQVAIADGLHTLMRVANGKVYIGAQNCTQTTSVGCLSIYSIAANTVTRGGPLGNVTSILPIKNRTVLYVIEGGNLRVYDANTNAVLKLIDIQGAVVDVKEID